MNWLSGRSCCCGSRFAGWPPRSLSPSAAANLSRRVCDGATSLSSRSFTRGPSYTGQDWPDGGACLFGMVLRADKDDLKGAGPVHALHAAQLDVAGGGRTADPGQGAVGARAEQGDGLGHELDDLGCMHDAEVVVGDERDDAPALIGGAVQDDRPGLGYRHGGPGDDAVQGIEVAGGQAVVCDDLDTSGQRRELEAIRHNHPPRPPPGQRPAARRAERVRPGAPDNSAVVGDALGEQVEQPPAVELASRPVAGTCRVAGALAARGWRTCLTYGWRTCLSCSWPVGACPSRV